MSNVEKLKSHAPYPQICPVSCAVAEVAVKAFENNNLADLKCISSDLSRLHSSLAEHISSLSPGEASVLVFSLNLAKDAAVAKALAMLEQVNQLELRS
ncbi:hypothetical protein [Shewanella sp. KCT]|uniref:hypothetical protein n=1 Tax=Shewanella sp. KCT TaxID=2569535 RepID=UPI0011824B12|nr:hypothetical protein [Shewanella sp. KCT]